MVSLFLAFTWCLQYPLDASDNMFGKKLKEVVEKSTNTASWEPQHTMATGETTELNRAKPTRRGFRHQTMTVNDQQSANGLVRDLLLHVNMKAKTPNHVLYVW